MELQPFLKEPNVLAILCAVFFQSLYENWFIILYTVFYTAMPVECLGIFEQVREKRKASL